MGIDSDIIKSAVKAFGDTSNVLNAKIPSFEGESVYIEDSLTRILWNPGPNEDFTYTGEQYFAMWFQPFSRHLSGFATDVVSTFDAPENVPRQKEKTQLARVIASAKASAKKQEQQIYYSEEMDFDDDGIFLPGRRDDTISTFSLTAVQKGPRGLRKKLWNYLFSKMKDQTLGDGRTLYLETDSISAWKFTGTETFVRDLSTSHGHGESDPSLAFWLEKTCFDPKRPKTAIIRSKDGDLVPILLHALEMFDRHAPPMTPRKPVFWQYKADQIFEMRAYLRQVKQRYKFTESQYMIFCILCGTDFAEKKLICNGFGVAKIFDAMEGTREAFNCWDTISPPKTKEGTDTEKEALMQFVRQLYQNSIMNTPKGVLAVVRNKNNGHISFDRPSLLSAERLTEILSEKKGKLAFPSQSNFDKAYQQISWNYRYWRDRSKWPKGMFGTKPLEVRSQEQFMAAAAASSSSSSSSSSSNLLPPHTFEDNEPGAAAELEPGQEEDDTSHMPSPPPAPRKARSRPPSPIDPIPAAMNFIQEEENDQGEAEYSFLTPPPKKPKTSHKPAEPESEDEIGTFSDDEPQILSWSAPSKPRMSAAAAIAAVNDQDTLKAQIAQHQVQLAKAKAEVLAQIKAQQLCSELDQAATNFKPAPPLNGKDHDDYMAAFKTIIRRASGSKRKSP